VEASKRSSEEGKKVEEKSAFTDSVQLFEEIFKEAAPSAPGSNKDVPVTRQKPLRKSFSADAPKFRRRIEPQERTFKVKIKDGKTVSADTKEPQQIDLPMRAQAERSKKAPKRANRKASGVALVGLTVLVILATPVFLHFFEVINLPGLPEFLNSSREVATPPPAPKKPMNKVPAKTAPPKTDPAGPSPAASVIPTPATPVRPEEAVEKTSASSPQPQSQSPEGSSGKEEVRPAATEVAQQRDGRPAPRPYSLYLGSFSTPEQARKALSIHQREDFPAYAVRMDFGDKGVWYRIFMGHFQTREEAEGFVAKHKIQGVEVKETKYAVRLGTFVADEAVQAKKTSLSTLGFFPYAIREADGRVSLYTGAFPRKEDAEKEWQDLKVKGIQAEPVER